MKRMKQRLLLLTSGRLDQPRLEELRNVLGLTRRGRLTDPEDAEFGFRNIGDPGDPSMILTLWRDTEDMWSISIDAATDADFDDGQITHWQTTAETALRSAGLDILERRAFPGEQRSSSPAFFRIHNGTMVLEEASPDNVTGRKLNIRTGAFEVASSDDVHAVLQSGTDLDFRKLTEEQFVKETEEARSLYLRGEGPIFDLYRKADEVYEQAKTAGRRINSSERDEIALLRRQTFQLWEEEFARQAAGEPPSFHYSGAGTDR